MPDEGQDVDPATGATVIVPKPRIGKPPCETKAGCAKGHWDKPLLGPREQQFLRVYHEAKGMGCWPKGWAEDGVVRRLAGVIEQATTDAKAIQADSADQRLKAVLTIATTSRAAR